MLGHRKISLVPVLTKTSNLQNPSLCLPDFTARLLLFSAGAVACPRLRRHLPIVRDCPVCKLTLTSVLCISTLTLTLAPPPTLIITITLTLTLYRRNSDSKSKRGEAAELYEGMVAAMERTRVGDHQVAALLLKLSEVSAPRSLNHAVGWKRSFGRSIMS